jgi:hypothetical protein
MVSIRHSILTYDADAWKVHPTNKMVSLFHRGKHRVTVSPALPTTVE